MYINLLINNKEDSVSLVYCISTALELIFPYPHNTNTTALPILDKDLPIGLITDRDICIRAVAKGLPLDTKVADIMTKNVQCIDPNEPVNAAVEKMESSKIRRLLVCDKDKKCLGVLSLTDIAHNARYIYRTILLFPIMIR